jgi:electron transport complex protein RnfE
MASTINTRTPLVIEPALVIGLGIVPALGAARDLTEALLLASGIITVQICTLALMLPLRRLIVPGHIMFFVTVIAGGFTALWSMIAYALLPEYFRLLSYYAYCIPVALPVLLVARTIAPAPGPREPAGHVMVTGLLACSALCLIAALREIIGAGTLLGRPFLFLEGPLFAWAATTSGGLTLAALVMAVGALVQRYISLEQSDKEATHDR